MTLSRLSTFSHRSISEVCIILLFCKKEEGLATPRVVLSGPSTSSPVPVLCLGGEQRTTADLRQRGDVLRLKVCLLCFLDSGLYFLGCALLPLLERGGGRRAGREICSWPLTTSELNSLFLRVLSAKFFARRGVRPNLLVIFSFSRVFSVNPEG